MNKIIFKFQTMIYFLFNVKNVVLIHVIIPKLLYKIMVYNVIYVVNIVNYHKKNFII